MMAINWDMGVAPDVGANALAAFEQGRQTRRADDSRNALATLVQDPNDTKAFGKLARSSPEIAMKFRENQVAVAKAQREQQQQQVQVMGNLLGQANDETSYQTALSAAKMHGIDTTGAPANYDPNWVNGMRMVVQAYQKDGGAQLTSTMKELVALGYKPGTPEFQGALAQALNASYAKPYTDASGATRLYTPQIAVPAQQTPQPPQAGGQQGAYTVDMYRGAVNGLGVQGASQWMQRNNIRVTVRTPQEAMTLPSGTPILLPDGSEGRVP